MNIRQDKKCLLNQVVKKTMKSLFDHSIFSYNEYEVNKKQ